MRKLIVLAVSLLALCVPSIASASGPSPLALANSSASPLSISGWTTFALDPRDQPNFTYWFDGGTYANNGNPAWGGSTTYVETKSPNGSWVMQGAYSCDPSNCGTRYSNSIGSSLTLPESSMKCFNWYRTYTYASVLLFGGWQNGTAYSHAIQFTGGFGGHC